MATQTLRVIGKWTLTVAAAALLAVPRGAGASETIGQKGAVTPDISAMSVLDLKTAMAVAIGGSPTLAAAAERVQQATERVKQAAAAWWPTLDATASASRVDQSNTDFATNLALTRALAGNPAATLNDPENYYTAGLSATWVLFDGFNRKFSIAGARYGEAQSQASLMEARRLLLSSVAASFHQAQLAREGIAISEAAEAFNLQQLDNAKARYRVGTGALSDTLNFEIQANSARADRITSERSYALAITGLAAIMGLPTAALPDGMELTRLQEETPEYMTLPAAETELSYAMDHRPDVQQIDYVIKQAEATVERARARYYPSIALSGSVDGKRAGDAGLKSDDFGNTIGVYLNYNLFSGGADAARIREAQRVVAEAQKNSDAVAITVANDIRQALASLTAAQRQLELQVTNAALVQQNRDLVEKEYNAGQGSLVRLNEAQRDLTQAQGRLALARVGLRNAWVNLESASARILNRFASSE
ncbi:MAG: TolC family protein [Pseudomonadota bacterium]